MNELWTEQGNNFRMNISGTEYEVSTHFDISGRQSLFAGLLYCPDGGAKLHFCASKSLKPNQEFYRCANYNSGRETCKIHYTCNVVLEKIVLEAVSSLADYVRYINRDKTPLYENVLMLEGIQDDVRICLATSHEVLEEGLNRLEACLKDLMSAK